MNPYARADWRTRPCVVIGGGWSLSAEQLEHVEQAQAAGACHSIVVNNSAQLAPWASIVYFGDFLAVKHYRPKLIGSCRGQWWTQDKSAAERFRMFHVKSCNRPGLGADRVHANGNSGAQALNLAALFGARRILLIGFDMRNEPGTGRAHWFGQHPKPLVQVQLFDEWLHKFGAIADDVRAMKLDVINCTPSSALTLFPMQPLKEALLWPMTTTTPQAGPRTSTATG